MYMSKNEYSNIKERSLKIMNLLKTLKALSHLNRIRIVNLLSHKELCVCELENIMGLNQSNVSRHLGKLQEADLILREKKAQWVYYKINEKPFNKHKFLQNILNEELKENSDCKEDIMKLEKYLISDISCKDLTDNNSNIFETKL